MVKCMTNMGTPHGLVRVRESVVLEHGFITEEARAWVVQRGGHLAEEGPRQRTDVRGAMTQALFGLRAA
jgi:hypothetical protein